MVRHALVLCLCFTPFIVGAQMSLRFQTSSIKLYRGYVNRINARVFHDSDTVTSIKFRAEASNAEIDYDDEGRMSVLPSADGFIRIIAQIKDKFYDAGTITFLAIEPPSLDNGIFVDEMGITKDDPKTSLKATKKFTTKGKTILKAKEVSFDWFPFYELQQKANIIKVTVIKNDGDQYSIQKGNVKLVSTEAKIISLGSNQFQIDPLQGKKRINIEIFFNNQRMAVERFPVEQSE
jgi:hypothetical protein